MRTRELITWEPLLMEEIMPNQCRNLCYTWRRIDLMSLTDTKLNAHLELVRTSEFGSYLVTDVFMAPWFPGFLYRLLEKKGQNH